MSQLTEEIYEAATAGMPWAPIGEGLMRLVQASSASLMVSQSPETEEEIIFRGDISLEAVKSYRQHYRKVDLWTNRAAEAAVRRGEAAPPVAWTSGTLVSDAEFLRSEFYSDFGRTLGLRHVVGTVLPLGPAGLMPVGLHRPDGAAPFERVHARLLELLLPHLRRAMQLRHRLGAANATGSLGLAALDAMATGVLVVDADLHVLVANAAAESMAGPGGAIRLVRSVKVSGGRATSVRALLHRDNAAFTDVVRATASRGSSGGAVPLRDNEGSIVAAALVYPLPRRLLNSGGELTGRVAGRALVLLRDLRHDGSASHPQLLRALFGLTQAEAEVALALVGGATKVAVAGRRSSQLSTIRTQVRSILAKTGAVNLRDLERILGSLREALSR